MAIYREHGSGSSISAYEVSSLGIKIWFTNGPVMLYERGWVSAWHLDEMARRARVGDALHNYILDNPDVERAGRRVA